MKLKNLKITCDDATTICDKNQYGEATVLEKIKLQIHFIKCKICRLYTKQNNLLSKAYHKKANDSELHTLCMSKKEKEAMKEELDKFEA